MKQTGYPSIDKPWLHFYDSTLLNNFSVPDQSVYQYIYDNNSAHLDDTALIFLGRKYRIVECFVIRRK